MISHLVILRSGLMIALCSVVNGCNTSGALRNGTAIRKPAMPTVATDQTPPSANVTDDEIFTAAIRLARNNDAAASVATLRSIADSSRRDRLTTQLVTLLAAENPDAAVKFATALPYGSSQAAAIEMAVRPMVKRDPEAALRWAVGISDPAVGRLARRAVVNDSVRENPRATIERVRALPPGSVRDDTLIMTAAAWARVDSEAVVSWLRGLPDDELKQRLASGVGFEIAQTNPNRALVVAEMLPAGRNRWLLFSAIAQTWIAVDSKAALAWAGQLPAGEPRDAAFAGVDTGLGVPVSRRIGRAPGIRGSRARGGAAVASLPEINSPAFAAWLATQSPGLSREEAILEYVRQRGAVEPLAIGPWITSLPGGSTRDRAMEIYVDNLLIGSPSEAARWLSSLPPSERSDELVEKTARRYLQTSPGSAATWLEEIRWPAERKEQLLREIGR